MPPPPHWFWGLTQRRKHGGAKSKITLAGLSAAYWLPSLQLGWRWYSSCSMTALAGNKKGSPNPGQDSGLSMDSGPAALDGTCHLGANQGFLQMENRSSNSLTQAFTPGAPKSAFLRCAEPFEQATGWVRESEPVPFHEDIHEHLRACWPPQKPWFRSPGMKVWNSKRGELGWSSNWVNFFSFCCV